MKKQEYNLKFNNYTEYVRKQEDMVQILFRYFHNNEPAFDICKKQLHYSKSDPRIAKYPAGAWRELQPYYNAMGFPKKLNDFKNNPKLSEDRIRGYVRKYWGQHPTMQDLCDWFGLDIVEINQAWEETKKSWSDGDSDETGSYPYPNDNYNPPWQNEDYYRPSRNGIIDASYTESRNSINRRAPVSRSRNQRRNTYHYDSAGSTGMSGAEDKDIGGTIGTVVFIVIVLVILAKTGIFSAFMSSFGSIFRFAGTLCMIAGVVLLAAGFLGNKLSKQEAERSIGLIILGANVNALTQEFNLIWLVMAGIGGVLIWAGSEK